MCATDTNINIKVPIHGGIFNAGVENAHRQYS